MLCNNIAARACTEVQRAVFSEFASDHFAVVVGLGLSLTKEPIPSVVNTCMRIPGSVPDNPVIYYNTLCVVLAYIGANKDHNGSLPAIKLAAFATTLH